MAKYPYPDARLIIFAKAPQPGYCKTRLIPKLGEEGAAQLQAELIAHCLSRLCQAPVCPTELWCSPDTSHPVFKQMARQYSLDLYQQQGGDLGARMHHAMAFRNSPYTIIVGTDCPEISSTYIENCIARLMAGYAAVIGPAEDGGYVLLGLQVVNTGLFQGISWGTKDVFSQTVHQMSVSGLSWCGLDTLWDLDDASDFARYQRLNRSDINDDR